MCNANIMKQFLLVLLLTTIFSCKREKLSDENIMQIVVNPIEGDIVLSEDKYFSDCNIIALESTDESLVSNINSVMYSKEFIAIFDLQIEQLVLFNHRGEFIRRINRKGRGPQEYISISCVAIDESNRRFIIYDDMTERLIFYSYDGLYLGEQKHELLIDEMIVRDGNLYVTYHHTSKNHQDWCGVIPLDGKSSTASVVLPFTTTQKTNYGMGGATVSINADGVLVTQRFDNTIYEIKNSTLTPKYTLDFGEYNIKKILEATNETQLSRMLSDYVYAIVNMVETDNYLAFTTNQGHPIIYDKHSRNVQVCATLRIPGMPISTSAIDPINNGYNKIMSVYDVSQLLKIKDLIKRHPEIKLENEKIKNIIDNIDENSNPIIIIYTLK